MARNCVGEPFVATRFDRVAIAFRWSCRLGPFGDSSRARAHPPAKSVRQRAKAGHGASAAPVGMSAYRHRSHPHASMPNYTRAEIAMYIGGGLLGTVLVILLIVWLMRRV